MELGQESLEAKLVNEMGKQNLESVKANERAAVESKILKKKKSNERCLKLLEECKKHGGPITSSDKDVRTLQALSKKELLNEVRYLRMTIAPNIKEKRRDQSGDKYKFECFTEEELI